MATEPRKTGTYLFVHERAAPARLPRRPDDEPPPRFLRLAPGGRVRRTPVGLEPTKVAAASALHFDPDGALAQAAFEAAQVLRSTQGPGLYAVLSADESPAGVEAARLAGCELAFSACFLQRTILVDASLDRDAVAARYGLSSAEGLLATIGRRQSDPEAPIEVLGVQRGLSVLPRGEGTWPGEPALGGVLADLARSFEAGFIVGLGPDHPGWGAARPHLRAVILVGAEAVIEARTRRRGPWGELPVATLGLAPA